MSVNFYTELFLL